MTDPWAGIEAAFDQAAMAGRPVRFWLRDDDAITATPALDRLGAVCEASGMPALLAVIPAGADDELARWIAGHPTFSPCQHGYGHTNHARPGERACELGGARAPDDVLEELAAGRRRMRELFGARLLDILVPPWNRIDPALVPALAGLGFSALSTFGRAPSIVRPPSGPIPMLNSHLDIVDWKGGRVGRDGADIAARLAPLVAAALIDGAPIGILTHHLAHDETAWAVLDDLLHRLAAHEGAAFTDAATLLARRSRTLGT